MKKILLILFVSILVIPAYAQDDDAAMKDFERRLELAEQMQDIRPARAQVDSAVDRYVMNIPADKREQYRTALKNILNYKALEKISVDAYAETYTVEELEAMVEYYSKPEAKSASGKAAQYAAKVYPEIIRMLDQAMIRAKTGGAGP